MQVFLERHRNHLYSRQKNIEIHAETETKKVINSETKFLIKKFSKRAKFREFTLVTAYIYLYTRKYFKTHS